MKTKLETTVLHDFQTNVTVRSHTRPVVVLFWGDACAPCNSLKPKLAELSAKHGFPVVSIKAELECRELLMDQKIRAVPTIIVFNRGVEVTRFSGDKTLDDLHNALAKAGTFQLPLL